MNRSITITIDDENDDALITELRDVCMGANVERFTISTLTQAIIVSPDGKTYRDYRDLCRHIAGTCEDCEPNQ